MPNRKFSNMPDKLKVAFNMATQDIKVNRIMFGKRTSHRELQEIVNICLKIAKKISA